VKTVDMVNRRRHAGRYSFADERDRLTQRFDVNTGVAAELTSLRSTPLCRSLVSFGPSASNGGGRYRSRWNRGNNNEQLGCRCHVRQPRTGAATCAVRRRHAQTFGARDAIRLMRHESRLERCAMRPSLGQATSGRGIVRRHGDHHLAGSVALSFVCRVPAAIGFDRVYG
jgi:hypothetical protein